MQDSMAVNIPESSEKLPREHLNTYYGQMTWSITILLQHPSCFANHLTERLLVKIRDDMEKSVSRFVAAHVIVIGHVDYIRVATCSLK